MKKIIILMLLPLCSTGAWAQQSLSSVFSIDSLDIEADLLIGNFKSGQMIQRLEGKVKLTMLSEKPSENMTLKANSIDFLYSVDDSTDKTPVRMDLEGRVRIIAEGMNITSESATIYLNEQRAVFNGYTEISTAERETPITGSGMTVNFETGDIRIKNIKNKNGK